MSRKKKHVEPVVSSTFVEQVCAQAEACYIIARGIEERALRGAVNSRRLREAAKAEKMAADAAAVAYQVAASKLYWREVDSRKPDEMSRLMSEALVSARQAWEIAHRLR